jgi:hypothetical protein
MKYRLYRSVQTQTIVDGRLFDSVMLQVWLLSRIWEIKVKTIMAFSPSGRRQLRRIYQAKFPVPVPAD